MRAYSEQIRPLLTLLGCRPLRGPRAAHTYNTLTIACNLCCHAHAASIPGPPLYSARVCARAWTRCCARTTRSSSRATCAASRARCRPGSSDASLRARRAIASAPAPPLPQPHGPPAQRLDFHVAFATSGLGQAGSAGGGPRARVRAGRARARAGDPRVRPAQGAGPVAQLHHLQRAHHRARQGLQPGNGARPGAPTLSRPARRSQ